MSGRLALSCCRSWHPVSPSYVERVRLLHVTSYKQHKNSLDQSMKLDKLNRRIKIIRNDVSGQFRPFYRGGKLYAPKPKQPHVDPLTDYKSHQYDNQSQAMSKDDVYVVSHYKPQVRNLMDTLQHLKYIANLDFIGPESHIIMKVNHCEVFTGKASRKKLHYYAFTKKLPHETDCKNKVCVFTDDEHMRNQAKEAGAFLAGGRDVVMQIIQRKVACDYYICTSEFYDQISKNQDLQRVLGRRFPDPKSATDNFLPILTSLVKETNFTNFNSATECKVVVGRLKDSDQNLKRNITFALGKLKQARFLVKCKDDLLKSTALSCFTEYVPFDFEALLNEIDQ